MNSLSIVLSFLTICVYYVLCRDSCPDPTLQPNFDLALYMGEWVEVESFKNPFQEGLTCVRANYTLDETAGRVIVVNSGFDPKSNKIIEMKANGTVDDPSKPADITVDFGRGPVGQYLVIETNYNHSLVYSCRNENGTVTEFAWILSRHDWVDQTVSILDTLKEKLKKETETDTTQFHGTEPFKCSGAAQTTLSLSLVAFIYLIIKMTV